MKIVKVILVGLFTMAAFAPSVSRAQQLVPPPSVTLAWSPSPDETVTGYNLYYGVTSTVTNKLDAGLALTATVTNLQAGTDYFFLPPLMMPPLSRVNRRI